MGGTGSLIATGDEMLESWIQWTCDGCGITEVWDTVNVPKYFVRKKLKESGWQNFGSLDYCPKCVQKGHARNRETEMNLSQN